MWSHAKWWQETLITASSYSSREIKPYISRVRHIQKRVLLCKFYTAWIPLSCLPNTITSQKNGSMNVPLKNPKNEEINYYTQAIGNTICLWRSQEVRLTSSLQWWRKQRREEMRRTGGGPPTGLSLAGEASLLWQERRWTFLQQLPIYNLHTVVRNASIIVGVRNMLCFTTRSTWLKGFCPLVFRMVDACCVGEWRRVQDVKLSSPHGSWDNPQEALVTLNAEEAVIDNEPTNVLSRPGVTRHSQPARRECWSYGWRFYPSCFHFGDLSTAGESVAIHFSETTWYSGCIRGANSLSRADLFVAHEKTLLTPKGGISLFCELF